MKIHRKNLWWLPKSYSAITLGQHVFIRNKIDPEGFSFKYILVHEKVHTLQVKEYGLIKFYFMYLYYYFSNFLFSKNRFNHFKSYLSIPFEVEAYDIEDWFDFQMNYLREPEYKDKCKKLVNSIINTKSLKELYAIKENKKIGLLATHIKNN